MLLVALLATTCAAADLPASPDAGAELAIDIHLAPPVPPWPEDLPPPQENEAGTFLPRPLADVVRDRLVYLDTYQGRCQTRIDAVDRVHRVELEAVRPGWSTPTLVGAVLVGVGAGVALTYVGVRAMR